MKRRLVTVLTAVALFGAALSGCVAQRPQPTAKAIDPDNAFIVVSMPTKSLERWNRDGSNLDAQLRELGFDTSVQYADNKTDMQISQIQNMVTQDVDVMVIAPIDGTVLAPVIEQAKAKGIPVISYDRLIEGSDGVNYYVSFDNFRVGEMQGEFLEEKLQLATRSEPANIELFGGSPDDPNAAQFFAGAWSVLQPYFEDGTLKSPSGKVPADASGWQQIGILGWDSAKAQSEMQTRLNSFYTGGQTLDAVLSPNDSLALGIEQALEARGFVPGQTWPLVTGQDADRANVLNMLDGKQAMTVWKDTRELGERTATMVDQIVHDQEVETTPGKDYDNGTGLIPTFLLTPVVVTADNVDSTLIERGFYTAEELNR